MKTNLSLWALSILMIAFLFACSTTKEEKPKFVLNGTIEGLTEGKIVLRIYSEGAKQDTATIKDGKFNFEANLESPTQAYLMIEEHQAYCMFYAENATMEFVGNIKDFRNAKITGGKAQDDLQKFNDMQKELNEEYMKLSEQYRQPNLTKEQEAKFYALADSINKIRTALSEQYIKENPQSYHAAVLATRKLHGKSAVEMEKAISELAPEMQKNPLVIKMLKKAAEMKDVEVGLDKIMANASNVTYKVDSKFEGEEFKDIVYLGLFSNNNICALNKDGSVQILDTEGKELSSFKPELEGSASSIALDENSIYVMSTKYETQVKKIRGKDRKINVPVAVNCNVFDYKGVVKKNFLLEGLITATGARVVDNNLIVSDCRKAKIAMFNKETGKAGAEINNMRPCCGILDFSVNDKKEVLVANLGAFRVQAYDFTGKNVVAFGSRGRSLDEFHGCCNPVSVAYLSNGAIVTVEKDPTRIKVYSKEGAKQIEGIEELVKGCSYIPMVVDQQDNLYLASAAKGLVK